MIKQIRIRDFKSIHDVTLELGDVTVLVGRSGTGKSNLVQAIRFLRNLLLGINAAEVEGGWERIAPAGMELAHTSFDMLFDLPGEEEPYSYRMAFSGRRETQILTAEQLVVGDRPVFGWKRDDSGRSTGWTHKPDLAQVPGVDGNFMLGRLPVIQKAVYAFAALSSGIGYYHFPSSVLGIHHAEARHKAPVPGLLDDGSNHLAVLKQIIQDFRKPERRRVILSSLRTVNPSITSAELDSLNNPQRVIVGHGEQKTVALSLAQESDGLRLVYIHLIALYQTPPKLTMVFEEPENAIFPGALSVLAEDFKAAPHEKRGQVLLTTHSPGLLDALDVESIRVVDMRDGQTVAGRVDKQQVENVQQRLMTTGELLTTDPARLDTQSLQEQKA